jgi:hypothetical protein
VTVVGTKGEKEQISVSDEIREHPAWFRLNDQMEWYDRKSGSKQRWYKTIKAAQLVLAGSIPVFALVDVSWGKLIMAVFGAGVAILEGVQQLGQYHDLWINYRSTAERLKHEKFLFLAQSGPYRGRETDEALKLLAERVEEQVSTEHAKWISQVEQPKEQDQT